MSIDSLTQSAPIRALSQSFTSSVLPELRGIAFRPVSFPLRMYCLAVFVKLCLNGFLKLFAVRSMS